MVVVEKKKQKTHLKRHIFLNLFRSPRYPVCHIFLVRLRREQPAAVKSMCTVNAL